MFVEVEEDNTETDTCVRMLDDYILVIFGITFLLIIVSLVGICIDRFHKSNYFKL